MKYRIDLRGALKDPLHWVWLTIYIGASMLLLGPLQSILLQAAGWGSPATPVYHFLPPATPAILAGGIEVAEGVLQFTDHTARGVWSTQVTSTLVALLFSYIIGPAFLVWGVRARSHYRRQMRVRGGVPAIVCALVLGGCSLSTVIPAPVYAFVADRAHRTLVRDSRHSEVLDELSVDLYMMARMAQVKYHRSGSPRGGEHSWLGQGRSGTAPLRMADLLDPSRGLTCMDSVRVTIDEKSFSVHVERRDSITLHGSVTCEPSSWSTATTSGAPDTLGMVVGVTPMAVNMILEE